MYKYLEILSILLILLFGSCKKGKNILIPDMGYKKLQITTSKTTYYWNQSEEDRIIAIQGELINESTITYYSRVGDYFGDSELLFFSENSAGRLETYDTLKKEWINSGLLGLLIEGSSFIPIEAKKSYSIRATLYIIADKIKETGIYRLRIDYFNDPDDEAKGIAPFSDYSNIFQIKS